MSFPRLVTLSNAAICLVVLWFLIASEHAVAQPLPWALSANDYAIAKRAEEHLKKKRWDSALSTAQKATDPVVYTLFQWLIYTNQNDTAAFSKIRTFILKHPHWPFQDRLQRHAENQMPPELASAQVLKWYDAEITTGKGKPQTLWGRLLLGEALLKAGKTPQDSARARRLIRDAYIRSNFGTEHAKRIAQKHKTVLDSSAHQLRLDRMIIERRAGDANKQIGLVPKEWREFYKIRIGLMQKKGGLNGALNKLPAAQRNHPEMIYERMRWRSNKSDYLMDDLIGAVTPPKYAYQIEPWWNVRKQFIRPLIAKNKFKHAYTIARNHGASDGAIYAEAEWLAGWISLRFLKDPATAYKHFFNVHKASSMPVSVSRGAYWAGRAAEANNNPGIAEDWYEVASGYPTTFYGQLATAKLGEKELRIPPIPAVTDADIAATHKNDLLKATLLLNQLKRHGQAREFLKSAVNHAKTPGQKRLIVAFGNQLGQPDYSIITHKESVKDGVIDLAAGYPLHPASNYPPVNPNRYPERAFINAITYQESYFRKDVVSPAGAMGLMQLMPGTARAVSKELKLEYSKSKVLNNTRYNVTLGSFYLHKRIAEFDGSYILGIASYNGGYKNANKWIAQNGDPRRMKNPEDVLDWIERIPFGETRNYVHRVLEHLQIYRLRLETGANKNQSLEILRDLQR